MRAITAKEHRLPGPTGSRWVIGRADPVVATVRAALARAMAQSIDDEMQTRALEKQNASDGD